MCTNNNLRSSCIKFLIATVASLSLIGVTLATQADELKSFPSSFNTAEAALDYKEGFIISTEGVIVSNSSPNYHHPQVTAIDDHHEEDVRKVKREITAELTGYSSTVDQTNSNPFVTASGAGVRDGIVAANFLEFGTELRIPEYFGDKVFVVKDRMNTRYDYPKDNSYEGYIDIWFHTRSEANNFGRVRGKVEILK